MARTAFNRREALFTSKLDFNLRETRKAPLLEHSLYGTENWTLLKGNQIYLRSFCMWCSRNMDKISWADRVRNEEVLHRVKGERNIMHTVERKEG